jgi:hypothetical protein
MADVFFGRSEPRFREQMKRGSKEGIERCMASQHSCRLSRPYIARPFGLAWSSTQLAYPVCADRLRPRLAFFSSCPSHFLSATVHVLPLRVAFQCPAHFLDSDLVNTLPTRHSSHNCPFNLHLHSTIHHGGRSWRLCRPLERVSVAQCRNYASKQSNPGLGMWAPTNTLIDDGFLLT